MTWRGLVFYPRVWLGKGFEILQAQIGAGISGKGNDQLPGSQVFTRGWRIKRFGYPLSLVALLLLFFFPWPGFFYALQVIHVQSHRNLLTFPFLSGQTFNISFTNSLYNAPVAEIFEAQGSEIYLKEIATRSWEVIEYYRLSGTISRKGEEIKVQDINFRVRKLSLMIGFIGKQQLTWRNRNYPLYRLSEPGGILLIEARSVSPALYLWQRAIQGEGKRIDSSPQEGKT